MRSRLRQLRHLVNLDASDVDPPDSVSGPRRLPRRGPFHMAGYECATGVMIVSAVAVQPDGQLLSVHVCTGWFPGLRKSTTTLPWSSVTWSPNNTETWVDGSPFTATTLLDPGFATISRALPPQMIVNVTLKCFVGSACTEDAAIATTTTHAAATAPVLAAKRRTFTPTSPRIAVLSAVARPRDGTTT